MINISLNSTQNSLNYGIMSIKFWSFLVCIKFNKNTSRSSIWIFWNSVFRNLYLESVFFFECLLFQSEIWFAWNDERTHALLKSLFPWINCWIGFCSVFSKYLEILNSGFSSQLISLSFNSQHFIFKIWWWNYQNSKGLSLKSNHEILLNWVGNKKLQEGSSSSSSKWIKIKEIR